MQRNFEPMRKQVEAWQRSELTDVTAKVVIYEAFVEGRLEEAESAPVITHLVACAPCRHTTAQLIRLESQFDPESDPTPVEDPGPVRSLLEHLAARVTPSFEEDVVFAYQDPEPDQNAELVGKETPEKPEDGN